MCMSQIITVVIIDISGYSIQDILGHPKGTPGYLKDSLIMTTILNDDSNKNI